MTRENKDKVESCACNIIREEVVTQAKEYMPQEEILVDLAEFFKIFGDSTRIKIVSALFTSEMCVCDIAALLEMNQSAISHQLRILKQARLVKYRREGKVVYYSLDDEHVQQIIECGLAHIKHK